MPAIRETGVPCNSGTVQVHSSENGLWKLQIRAQRRQVVHSRPPGVNFQKMSLLEDYTYEGHAGICTQAGRAMWAMCLLHS